MGGCFGGGVNDFPNGFVVEDVQGVCVRDLRSLRSRRCVGGRIEVGMVAGRGYWAVGGWKEHWLRFVRSNQLICV